MLQAIPDTVAYIHVPLQHSSLAPQIVGQVQFVHFEPLLEASGQIV